MTAPFFMIGNDPDYCSFMAAIFWLFSSTFFFESGYRKIRARARQTKPIAGTSEATL